MKERRLDHEGLVTVFTYNHLFKKGIVLQTQANELSREILKESKFVFT